METIDDGRGDSGFCNAICSGLGGTGRQRLCRTVASGRFVAHAAGDPWQEALIAASRIQTAALVIDTEIAGLGQTFGQARELAQALHAEYLPINQLETNEDIMIALAKIQRPAQSFPL